MRLIFSVDELSAIDLLRHCSIHHIQQRITHLSRVAVFESLAACDAKELEIARLAYNIAGPYDTPINRAAHAAIIERRNSAWQRNKVTH